MTQTTGTSSAARRDSAAPLPEFRGSREEDESHLELAYRRVRAAILSNELAPGSIVSQVKLATAVGVSRTPLREALRLLQNEGLVTSEHNRRVRISELTTEDLEELYALRITNEAMAIRNSVPLLTEDELGHLRQLLDDMVQVESVGDFNRWELIHHEFHQRLLAHAGPRVIGLTDELATHAERYRRAYISTVPRAWSIGDLEHGNILTACVRRDPDEAASQLAKHLGRTALSLIAVKRPDYDPASVRAAIRMFAAPE